MRTVGEIIYFYPEEMIILVVMANEDGIRYIDPENLQFDDNGNVITRFISNDVVSEWCVSVGSIREFVIKTCPILEESGSIE